MSPEEQFVMKLRFEDSLLACDEVPLWPCRADVVAIDYFKEQIYEYEFKRNSHDLKVAEKRKEKYKKQRCNRTVYKNSEEAKQLGWTDTKWLTYKKEPKRCNRFYFVIPIELWEKEEKYLETLKGVGVIVWEDHPNKNFREKGLYQFRSVKKVTTFKSNIHNFNRVKYDFIARCQSKMACLLQEKQKNERRE